MSGPRPDEPMGMELAELRLLEALRAAATDVELDVRVIGGRGGRRHARRVGARWIPARCGSLPSLALAGSDIVHLLGLDLPPPRRKAFVAMVHDLAPLVYEDEGALPPWTGEIAERASLFLTPSEFTAGEVRRHLGVPAERVTVIGSGPALDARLAEPLAPSELQQLSIEPPFVLRSGGYSRRKNVPLLLKAWTSVPDATLVLTGPPQPARAQILAEAPSLDRVVVLDYVPEALQARLLRSAAALVSTSSYEGFGLPTLEALSAGTPVVAVAAPYAREVCSDAALLVDERVDALADGLGRVIHDQQLAHLLRQRGLCRAVGFTWNRTAAAVLSAYARLSDDQGLV